MKRLQSLFEPVDTASTVFFRIAFGLTVAWDLYVYLSDGRLERFYSQPAFFFKYPGFAWVEPAAPETLRLVFWGLVVCALNVALGLLYRLSATLLTVGLVYIFLLDEAVYNNHNYLICLLSLLMIFVPAHRSGSLDAVLRPRLRHATLPAWGLWILRFQIGVPYFLGGVAKLNGDWLFRAQPMKLWLTTGGVEITHLDFLKTAAAAYFFSWGGLFFDLLIVPLLLFKRTRIPAYLSALAFHLTNAHLFNIGIFPWLMIFATTIFLAPDWPRRVGLVARRRVAAVETLPKITPKRRAIAGALALFVAVQVVLPFRHLLFPGNVDWTDEGHRFAWRMKLRDKRGDIRFLFLTPGARQATRQATVLEGYEALLTPYQRLTMTQDPEMIRQFAGFLAGQLREKGYGEVEIRVQSSISFNGRKKTAMIDPEVDLAAQSYSWWKAADWILPLPEDS